MFPTRTEPPPSPETVSLLSGVIAISPLVELGVPAPKVSRQLVKTVSSVIPNFPFNPPLPPEVCHFRPYHVLLLLNAGLVQRVSRDPAVVASFAADPLLKTRASAQAMWEMLAQVRLGYFASAMLRPYLLNFGTSGRGDAGSRLAALAGGSSGGFYRLTAYQSTVSDLLGNAVHHAMGHGK